MIDLRRGVLAALALAIALAGCSSPATGPSGQRPVALPAEFQGEWSGHGRGMTVNGNGTAVLTYRTYDWCTGVQTTGCDRLDGNRIEYGGRDEMVFTSVAHAVASGTIRKSTSGKLVGSAVTLAVHPDRTAVLHQAKQPDSSWTFCAADAVNVLNDCGA